MVAFKDLTLREGAQVPGLQISETAGRRVLTQLAELNIGRVEVAFPRAQHRESWFRYADDLGLRTAALARALPKDIDAALKVDPDEIEVIVTTSDVQLEYALGKSKDEARDLLVSNVERAIDGGVDAGVTLMDAMRADNEYLAATAHAASEAGAKHVTLADTTGAGTPDTVSETVTTVGDAVGNDVAIAIHTHDDMGVATANAVAGVDAGASAVDATVGGIGERAGNAPLEEVAVLLAERGDTTELTLDELVPVCRAVHESLGVDVPPGKSVIGNRAYRHESGMHTAAMLKEPSTYEPFDPAKYGGERELLFGKDTGRGAVRALLKNAAVEPTPDRVDETLAAIRIETAEKNGPLTESDARELVRNL
ncbi:LeuA family protein [Natrinema soli]|uniref:2-isopropylmalate synthase n=1 Tax=Natrinema soli TaxID=1930624 RepID=A0ABD5SNW5_9EURY|nr:LeuA family protein [Natrinema soli]